jgi:alpha-methylacyl-CoA racemase
MLLADMGADVVRIERPDAAVVHDPSRIVSRGKRSVVLDLKTDADLAVMFALLSSADVLIEGLRPGVMERIGLGPDAVLAHNPRIVYGRMTGWGQDGPWSNSAGHDINYIAITGALAAIGRAEGPPQVPINLLGDFGGGTMFLLLGIVAALFERATSGLGQVVDAAIVDGTAVLSTPVWGARARGEWTDSRGSNRLDTGWPFYDVYETCDGHWISIGALEAKFFVQLVEALDLPEWRERQFDRSGWPEMRAAFTRSVASRTRDEWAKVFDGTDCCAAPVLTWGEALNHPHLAARETYVDHDRVPQPAPAPRFSRTPSSVGRIPAGVSTVREVLDSWGVAAEGPVLDGRSEATHAGCAQ